MTQWDSQGLRIYWLKEKGERLGLYHFNMNNEEKILKTLKDFPRSPTNKVAAIIGVDFHRTLKLLQKMWEQGKINGEIETHASYWSLKTKAEVSKPKKAESPDSQKDKKEGPDWY